MISPMLLLFMLLGLLFSLKQLSVIPIFSYNIPLFSLCSTLTIQPHIFLNAFMLLLFAICYSNHSPYYGYSYLL